MGIRGCGSAYNSMLCLDGETTMPAAKTVF